MNSVRGSVDSKVRSSPRLGQAAGNAGNLKLKRFQVQRHGLYSTQAWLDERRNNSGINSFCGFHVITHALAGMSRYGRSLSHCGAAVDQDSKRSAPRAVPGKPMSSSSVNELLTRRCDQGPQRVETRVDVHSSAVIRRKQRQFVHSSVVKPMFEIQSSQTLFVSQGLAKRAKTVIGHAASDVGTAQP